MGFCSLQHIRNRRSTVRRFTSPLRSAFRVWLPSWRFTPFDPVPVLFHTGGAHGIDPSELSPRGRCPVRFRPDGPTYRSPYRCSRRRSGGPAQQAAVPGLWPFRESLATFKLLTRRPLDAPVGFTLLGFCYESRNQDSARSPLTRFAGLMASHRTHRRPRVSLSFRWRPPDYRTEARRPGEATLLGLLHRSDPNTFERAALRCPLLLSVPCSSCVLLLGLYM
jgi:hypothetical protein